VRACVAVLFTKRDSQCGIRHSQSPASGQRRFIAMVRRISSQLVTRSSAGRLALLLTNASDASRPYERPAGVNRSGSSAHRRTLLLREDRPSSAGRY
jgi:hypothetical protein